MWRDEYSALSMSYLGRMKCDARKGSCVCMYTYVCMMYVFTARYPRKDGGYGMQ